MPYQTAALNDQRRSAVFSPVSLRGFFSILLVSLALIGCGGKKITAIAAGIAHSFAVDSDGKVYAAGYNVNGQLGLGDKSDRDEFAEVEFNSTTTR
ncbi:MAG: hypothetical protein LBC09_04360 [Helicobacteraceae bacterium]|jgi:alpha-tubulin suppressor-like RCC1 family protein|nr:hypothetical protein [Helicobacteraceae bacterium]